MTERINNGPTIHLNGSDAGTLREGYRKAWDALEGAAKALVETAPHMRDYYVHEDGEKVFDAVRKAHIERLVRIEAMKGEILGLWEGVQSQVDARSPSAARNAGENTVKPVAP